MRLAIISLARAPYWDLLYGALDRTKGLTVRVFYLQPEDSVRGWSSPATSYDAVQFRCLTPEVLYSLPLLGVVNPGLTAALERFSPDCLLLHGYSYVTHLLVVRWAGRHGVPYLLWATPMPTSCARGVRFRR